VQGVGFRPFVYRIASEEALGGHVLNDEQGVLLEAEGDAGAVARFVHRLSAEAPPLAAVERVLCDSLPPRGERAFRILESARTGLADAPVAPDTATCPDCLAELLDPDDRRHRYPFVNCTNCGPRFTIVRGVPYDRPLTTMSAFAMCDECRREYEDPLDRRFHAQPNACPVCGPRVSLIAPDGSPAQAADVSRDPVGALADCLATGQIAAVKGIGGYHLVCDAGSERAVAALRARKHREDKPFALMVADVVEAGRLVRLDAEARELLTSPARPIVLAPRLPRAPVAPAVAPGAPELGVMLPYSPLHQLLIRDFAAASGHSAIALVMTSGNVSDEPIAYRDHDALERLAPIADVFLVHDREFETRTDDSVVRAVRLGDARAPGTGTRATSNRATGTRVAGAARTLTLRRSRGYVPGHLELPIGAGRPLLACGAEQKSTFCLARGSRAWVGHHIGDLEQFATLEAFRTGIEHFERLFAVSPALVAHDLHPGYLSTEYALARDGVECVGVQHHHAHLAACLAEHGLQGPAVGAIFDGTGYGLDGTVWGGELLVGGLTGFERAGTLWPVRMPGGAAAIRQPWRMAHAWLSEALNEPPPLPARLEGRVDGRRWNAMTPIGASGEVSPVTSSLGRLFDAVGALCGTGVEVSYEGQAAVELEAAAWTAQGDAARPYEIALCPDPAGALVLDPRAAVRALAGDLAGGTPPSTVAARFHAAVAGATVAAVSEIASARGLEIAVLSGGVFQNRLLLETVAAGIEHAGLRVLVPERLPPNDGGISFGQAAIAAAMQAR
jgi:hydrogenase maturation protein HypF